MSLVDCGNERNPQPWHWLINSWNPPYGHLNMVKSMILIREQLESEFEHGCVNWDFCLCLFTLIIELPPFFLTGIILPSIFSAIYFLLFIGVCTWWACHLPLSNLGFNALCVMVGFFTSGHMVCLYLYQSLMAQALFPPYSLWAR